jgi:hypothetical protein
LRSVGAARTLHYKVTMTALTDFLFPAPAPRTIPGILHWWESRRLRYNLIVGGCGVFSLAVMRIMTWLPPRADRAFMPLGLVLVFGVMANVCYLLGPTVEIALDKLWGRKALPTGPTLFRMGLTFSAGLALLPTLFAGLDWAFRIVRFLFF